MPEKERINLLEKVGLYIDATGKRVILYLILNTVAAVLVNLPYLEPRLQLATIVIYCGTALLLLVSAIGLCHYHRIERTIERDE